MAKIKIFIRKLNDEIEVDTDLVSSRDYEQILRLGFETYLNKKVPAQSAKFRAEENLKALYEQRASIPRRVKPRS